MPDKVQSTYDDQYQRQEKEYRKEQGACLDGFFGNISNGGCIVDEDSYHIFFQKDYIMYNDDFTNTSEAMLHFRREVNDLFSKLKFEDINDLSYMIDSGTKLFSHAGIGGINNYFTPENQEKWMNLVEINDRTNRAVNQLNETFIDAGIDNKTARWGFNAYAINGDIFIEQNHNTIKDSDGENKGFNTSYEAFQYLKENYPAQMEDVELDILPFKDRAWTSVPPKYRTNEQVNQSIDSLNNVINGLGLKNYNTIDTQRKQIQYDNPQRKELKYQTESVEDMLMHTSYDPLNLGHQIDDALCNIQYNHLTDKYTTEPFAHSLGEVLNSRYLPEDLLGHEARKEAYSILVTSLNSIPETLKKVPEYESREKMSNEIDSVKDLLDCVGLYGNLAVSPKDSPYPYHIELRYRYNGQIYSNDPDIQTAKDVVNWIDDQLDAIFLCGEICCNYPKDFSSTGQAYWTCMALNETDTAKMIEKYAHLQDCEIGFPIDVPFSQNKEHKLEFGKGKNGNLYIKKNTKTITEMSDTTQNRVKMQKDFTKLVEQEQNRSGKVQDQKQR